MFGLLKDKLAGFVNKLIRREEEKPPAEAVQKKEQQKIERKEQEEKKAEIKEAEIKEEAKILQPKIEKKGEEEKKEKEREKARIEGEKEKGKNELEAKKPIQAFEQNKAQESNKKQILDKKAGDKQDDRLQVSLQQKAPIKDNELERLEKKALSQKEHEMKVKIGIGKSVLGLLSNSIVIEENDVRDLLDELEIALLESDVAVEVSAEVSSRLRSSLIGMRVEKKKIQEEVQKQIRKILQEIMASSDSFDFIERVCSKPRPVKILFVGPNGAGKTTTMAKLAHKLKQANLSVIFSASDTFRAAAIEQTEEHAKRLGIPVIKSRYGADPASVAWDAVNYAKAHQIDVVLIDSAGRQDTNTNLLDELKKMNRVINPDLKIYIGESIGGQAMIEQVRAFHQAIHLDGAILTKLDCDAKGGTALSLAYATGVPILFLGTGQGYDDLQKFDAQKIAEQILT
jgi:fused signal recognition particle receptor